MSSSLEGLREALQQQQQQQQQGGAAHAAAFSQGGEVYEDLLYSCYIEHPTAAPLLLAAHAAALAGYKKIRSSNSSSSSSNSSNSNNSSLTDEEIDLFVSQAAEFVMPLLPHALQQQLLQHELLQQQKQQQQQDPVQQEFATQLLLLLDACLAVFPLEDLQCHELSVHCACELLALLPKQRRRLFCLLQQEGLFASQQQQQQQQDECCSSGLLRLLRAYISLFPYGVNLTLQLLTAILPQPQQQEQQQQQQQGGEDTDCDIIDMGCPLQFLLLLAQPLTSMLLPPIEGLVFALNSSNE